MKIAIIGAGNAGYAHACKFSESGHEVHLVKSSHSLHEKSFDTVLRRGGIWAVDSTNQNKKFFAKLAMITRDPAAAIPGCDVVFVLTQSLQHEIIARRISPFFEDGQLIIIAPGNMGSIYFKRHAKGKDLILAEGESLPFDARIIKDGVVNILFKNVRNALALIPANRSKEGLNKARKVVDTYQYLRNNIIESALHNPNLIVHTTGVIMSASRIEYSNGIFSMYREAFTPSVWNLVEALDGEKTALLKQIGCRPLKYLDACKFRNEKDMRVNSLKVFRSYAKCGPMGPSSVKTRYMYEDVPMGLCLMSSVGEKFGVKTPVCNSLISIASSLLKTDFMKEGRTLEKLGLGNMTKKEIIDYVTK